MAKETCKICGAKVKEKFMDNHKAFKHPKVKGEK